MKNKNLVLLALFGVGIWYFFMRSRAQKIETKIEGINDQWDSLFVRYGKEFGVNPRLMKSIAANESLLGQFSGYEPNGGTRGLMHIKLGTAQDYEKDLTEYDLYWSVAADENQIRVATKHMKRLLKKFGHDEKKAVQAYNAGEGRIQQFITGKIESLPKTTVDYWDRYNRNFERLG